MEITTLLYRIKENIKAVEGGDESASLLDELRADFLELMELIKLFLISERDSYYGYFLMNMQFSANFRADCIAGIKLNTFPPVFEANPLLLCRFTLKEIIYVVCHEIDHVVMNHPAEMVKANPSGDPDVFYRFNLAADASVNDRINHEIVSERHGFMSPPDGLITSSSLKTMFNLNRVKPLENYAYYFELIKERGGNDQNSQNGQSGQNGQESMLEKQMGKGGSGEEGEGSDGEVAPSEGKGNGRSGEESENG